MSTENDYEGNQISEFDYYFALKYYYEFFLHILLKADYADLLNK